ncbi:MAG TPA: SPFH domain-containing protein [Planktothrix sp.]
MEILGGILVLTFVILLSGIKIVRENNKLVVFRFGKVLACRGPGLQMIVPIIDRGHMVDTRIMVLKISEMEILTQDDQLFKVAALVMMQLHDPLRALTRIDDPTKATVETAQAVLLSVLNKHSAKELIHDQRTITRSLKADLEKRTRHWGIRIKSIDINYVVLPLELKEQLEQKLVGAPDNQNNGNSIQRMEQETYKYHVEI